MPPASTVVSVLPIVLISADFAMKPAAPSAIARCTSARSSTSATTITAMPGANVCTCTNVDRPLTPGILRSSTNRSNSVAVLIAACRLAKSQASTISITGIVRRTHSTSASRNSGWSSATSTRYLISTDDSGNSTLGVFLARTLFAAPVGAATIVQAAVLLNQTLPSKCMPSSNA